MKRSTDRREREPLAGGRRWIVIAIAVITLFVFMPVFANQFTTWDDEQTLWRNPSFNPPTLAGILEYWVRPHMDLYVPVTYTLWGLLAMLAYSPPADEIGALLSTAPFHLANVALHAGSAMLCFLLIRRCLGKDSGPWPAAIGALLFALHPIQVEAVAWLSGMKDVLFAFLSLLAVYLYVARKGSRSRYLLATLAFAAALLSKPTAVVVPLIALLLDHAINRPPLKRSILPLLPWFAMSAAVAILAKLVQPAPLAADVPLYLRPLVAADALAFYLLKLLLPLRLGIDYGRSPQAIIESGAIYFTWLLPLVLIVTAWLTRRTRLWIGLFMALIPLLPLLGLVRFDYQVLSTVTDHYLYLPMAGIGLACAFLLHRKQTSATYAVAGVLLVCFAGLTIAQLTTWRSSRTLFSHALEVNPGSWAGGNNLAVLALSTGDAPRAVEIVEQSLQRKPPYLDLYITAGMAYAQLGRLEDAKRVYEEAVRLDPKDASALASLAAATAQLGDLQQGLELVRRAIEIDPREPLPHANYAVMLAEQGNLTEAAVELAKAVELDPTNVNSRLGLATLLAETGQRGRAVEQLREANRLQPGDPRITGLLRELGGR